MSKENNLKDFLIDLADGIRAKKGTTEKIDPQDFRAEIEAIVTGVIEVTELPTENIDTNAVYSMGGKLYRYIPKVTNLTGTIWYVKSGWEAEAALGQFEVNCTYEGKTYNRLGIGYGWEASLQAPYPFNNFALLYNEGTTEYAKMSGGNAYTISIIDGNDVESTKLIEWFDEWGELQSGAVYEWVEYLENGGTGGGGESEEGGGSLSLIGKTKRYRVAPDESIDVGSFVNLMSAYGDNNFTDRNVDNISLCRADGNTYVFFRDTSNSTNCAVKISIDGELNQVVVSPTLDLGNIAAVVSATAVDSQTFVLCYRSSTGYNAYVRTLILDFENNTVVKGNAITVHTSSGKNYITGEYVMDFDGINVVVFVMVRYTGYSSNTSNYGYILAYMFDTTTKKFTLLGQSANVSGTSGTILDVQRLDENRYVILRSDNTNAYVAIAEIYASSSTFYAVTKIPNAGNYTYTITQTSAAVSIASPNTLCVITEGGDRSNTGGRTTKISLGYYKISESNTISALYTAASFAAGSTVTSQVAMQATLSGNVYAMYSNPSSIRVIQMVLDSNSFTYKQVSIVSISTPVTGKCLPLDDNSFLWFYGSPSGKFMQRDVEFQSLDNDIIGNAYVSRKVYRNNQYIGVATSSAKAGQLISVCVPYELHAIDISCSNCSAVFEKQLIYDNEELDIQIVAKNTAYLLPETITVTNAKYTWNSLTGMLKISEPTGTVKIQISAAFTGKYTSSAKETTSGTELTSSVNCNVGDLVVAAIVTRDTLTLSDGWTLVSTSEVNSTDTYNQRLSWAYKFAESTTESITVTQASAQRLYINMVALQGATGITDNGYSYLDDISVNGITVNKPEGRVLWGLSAPLWDSSSPYETWSASNDMPIIQLGNTSQARLGLGLDQSDDTSVTFKAGVAATQTSFTTLVVGCLTVQGMDKFY